MKEPLAQSPELTIASTTGQWYNFSINFPAEKNTTYWFGYYADNPTQYYYDSSNNSSLISSELTDDLTPVQLNKSEESTMSLYMIYAPAPTNNDENESSATNTNLQNLDFSIISLIMLAETAIVIINTKRKLK